VAAAPRRGPAVDKTSLRKIITRLSFAQVGALAADDALPIHPQRMTMNAAVFAIQPAAGAPRAAAALLPVVSAFMSLLAPTAAPPPS
jgi:hypothetical protein